MISHINIHIIQHNGKLHLLRYGLEVNSMFIIMKIDINGLRLWSYGDFKLMEARQITYYSKYINLYWWYIKTQKTIILNQILQTLALPYFLVTCDPKDELFLFPLPMPKRSM